MLSSQKILAAVVLITTLLKGLMAQAQVTVNEGDNVEQFSLLCQIYNVAKNPTINYVDPQDSLKLVEEIEAFSASLADEEWFSEVSQSKNSVTLSYDFKKAYPDYLRRWDTWKKAVTKVSSGTGISRVNPTTREAKVAQIRIQQISKKAHKVLEEIEKLNVTREAEKAKDLLRDVVFGDNGREDDLCHATVPNGRSGQQESRLAACGEPSRKSVGASAGKNLVVDFFCLCAADPKSGDKAGKGVENVCGATVGAATEYQGWGAFLMSTKTMWKEVKDGCAKFIAHEKKSSHEVRALLRKFLTELVKGGKIKDGGNAKPGGRKPGMLGTTVSKNGESDITCNGKKGDETPSGICVFYGDGNWEENIQWLKKFNKGLDILDALQNKTASIQANLKALQDRAEDVYEEAKAAAELEEESIGEPVQIQNTTENQTEHNTNHSHSHNPRLFLPWVLLL